MELNRQYDPEDTNLVADQVMAILSDLRPSPDATVISRKKLELIAAISGDTELQAVVKNAEPNCIFWQVDGRYVKQVVEIFQEFIS